ncbi:MAG: L,D-transpeptidase family protein [Syntrophorhabdaceae bacterium]|nr:L,D-transpeptidase family protein [Syntrophorhabdaceae bacterium]
MERQFIVVEAKGIKDFRANIRCYEKKEGECRNVYTFDCVVGKEGIVSYEKKREGDGATPSGIYTLGFVFGYGEKPFTKMMYERLTEEDKWIDDPEHPMYNMFLRGNTDAKSYEIMKRTDDLYKLGIVVNFNREPVIKNKGSAIFIHIWKDRDTPTHGCIALDEESLKDIIEWLDPHKKPVIVIKQP